MRTAHEPPDQSRPVPVRDVPLSLAEAVVSCLALRDIPRLRAHYPSALRAEDAAELRAALTGHLRAALADSMFDDLRVPALGLNLDAPATDADLTALLFALLLRMPGTLPTAPDGMRKAVAACQDRIGPPLKDIVTQLGEIKLFDCRIPEGDPTFLDPRRSLQLLRAYWSVCRSLVLHQIDAPIGFQPHPLRRVIVSLRSRIEGHLTRLTESVGSAEAKAAMDSLLDCVLGGDPDDLAAAPEWSRQQVANVEAFLEDVRLRAGSKVFPLTHEEEVFIAHAEGAVQQYQQRVDEEWARMLARADARAAQDVGAAAAPRAAAPGASVPAEAAPAQPVEALTATATLLLSVLESHAGSPWPGSATLRREVAVRRARERGRTPGARPRGDSVPKMRKADFPKAIAELMDAKRIYPKDCAALRKGCAWGLRRIAEPRTAPSRNQVGT
jgi:hypothetical protein